MTGDRHARGPRVATEMEGHTMRRTTRTIITFATAAMVVLAMTATAFAKKPDNPGEPATPELVSITMTLVDGQGISTECSGGTILMERSGNELFPVADEQIGLYVDGVDTTRKYPEPTTREGFAGCHGGDIDGNPVPYGGFGITLNDAGEPTDVLWHFDYYLETEQLNKKRTRLVVMEHFTLSGHDLTFDEATSTVSGDFAVLYHLEELGGDSIGYEPVAGSPAFLSFTFDMQPQG
jgi:hypothetical protein